MTLQKCDKTDYFEQGYIAVKATRMLALAGWV